VTTNVAAWQAYCLLTPYLKSNVQPLASFVVRNNHRALANVFLAYKWFYSEGKRKLLLLYQGLLVYILANIRK